MSKIEKFMYLKSYLKGEALKIIEGVQLTNDNFDVALKSLKDRFGNKLYIINNHLNSIIDSKKFLSNFTQIRALLTLGI